VSLEVDETLPAPEPPTREPAAEKAALPPLAARALTVFCVALIGFLLFQILTFGHGRDQGIYTVVARTLLEGGMPYRDAFDFKPPGIFLIYGLARVLFGSAQWGIRVLEVFGLTFMSFGLVRLGRDWFGSSRIGLAAATIAVLAHAQLDFWHTAQPESFGGMITIAALLCAPRPSKTPTWGWLAAGFLFGFAFLLKPPLVGGAAVVALAPAVLEDDASKPGKERLVALVRKALRPALLLAAGGATPILLCIAWFFAKGALSDLYQVLFVFTPHYTAIGWQGATVSGMLYYAFTEWLQHYGSVPTVGLLLALGLGVERERRPLAGIALGVIAIHLVGVAMQGKFFPYHYGATWPLTAIVAALGYAALFERAHARGIGATLAAMAFVAYVPFARSSTKDVPGSFLVRTGKRLAIAADGFRDQKARDALASVADVNTVTDRAVAEIFRAEVPPDRPVFVWGFEPTIYDMAERASSTRYIYNVAQRVTWAREEHRRVLMEDLAKNPPAAIAVQHWDVFPMVTGEAIDSADGLRDFPELQTLLDEKYTLYRTVVGIDVYLEAR